MTQTFEIGDHSYSAGKVPPFDQMAIAKRLMPVMKTVFTPDLMAAIAMARGGDGALDLKKLDITQILPTLADAVYALTDEDAERIVRTSLKVVQRKDKAGIWSAVMNVQGGFQYDDIELPEMLQIAWKVIEANLGSFFSTAR